MRGFHLLIGGVLVLAAGAFPGGGDAMAFSKPRATEGGRAQASGRLTIRVPASRRDQIFRYGVSPLLMQVRSERVEEAGKTIGYRLFDFDDGCELEAFGVRDGDVVVEALGEPITGIWAVLSLMSAIDDLRDGIFVVLRDGRRLEIRVVVI